MRIPLTALLLLAACSLPRAGNEPAPEIAVIEAPGAEVTRPHARPGAEAGPGVLPGAAADGSTPPPPAPGAGGLLGETLAGLGATGGPGLWVQTGLVATPRPGRVITATGATLAVELRPSGAAPSAGSTISVAAMQALSLPLGSLATLRVFAD